MTLTGSDLGPLRDLAGALGLVSPDGAFQDDWLSEPSTYLSTMLADDAQRQALLGFVDEVLGGAEQETDADGLIWLPLVSNERPNLTVFAVVDVQPAYIGIGIGASITSATAPTASATVHVPLFRAARRGQSVADPILLGRPGAAVRVRADITVDTAPPVDVAASLGGIAIDIRVPTGGEAPPQISLDLRQLRLPGAAAATDLSLSLADADELAGSVLHLVLGLVQAQAAALGSGPLPALATMLGLNGGAIPALPLQDLATSGAAALTAWFNSVVGDATARAAWLTALADLVGGGATASADALHLAIGSVDLALAAVVASGPGGHPIITVRLTTDLAVTSDVRLRAVADAVTLDLGTGSALALPRLDLVAVAGQESGAGTALLTGDPACRAVRVGFGLDGHRRPVFVLAADGVNIGGVPFDTLDLTNPEALADAAGAAVEQVLTTLLNSLGPGVATAIRVLTGLDPPAGFPAVPTVPPARLVADPLGAVREHWNGLITDHRDAMLSALRPIRDLVSDAGRAAVDISGTGSSDDPWTIPLVGPVEFHLFTEGSVLHVAAASRYVVDTLGQRCTRVETVVRIGVAALDLAGGSAAFCSGVEARLTARAKGADPAAIFAIGDVDVRADVVGLAARWTPSTGVAVDVLAPNLAIVTDDGTVPLVLPEISGDGSVTLDAAGWDGVEAVAALLAAAAPAPWLGHLIGALGWRYDGVESAVRLRLADLVTDPVPTLRHWALALAFDRGDPLEWVLHTLARIISGTASAWGVVSGAGRPDDPYVVPLGPDSPTTPQLAVWLLPDGPARAATNAGVDIRSWQPGARGLSAQTLAEAVADEATVATDLADLLSGRPDLAAGLDALATRWSGTDGLVVPPTTAPAGVTVHLLDDLPAPALLPNLDLATLLGRPPAAVLLHVAVAAPADDITALHPDIPAERRLDLRAAGREPASFPAPAPGDGSWLVVLGQRADCALATGDPDGVAGQAQRLRRVLPVFGAGTVTVVATSEAGHAVLQAVAEEAAVGNGAVADVVTLGTPFGPVAFTIVDDQPAADTLRLLYRLLPLADPADPDDEDLAVGRALVEGLHVLTTADDPGRELRPPAAGLAAVPAGIGVHAIFGVVSDEAIARGVTAVVAAGLAGRARARAAVLPPAITGVRAGLRLPVPPLGTTVTAGGWALLELGGLDLPAGNDPADAAITTDRFVHTHLELRRASGWLVGGPDPGRSPGPRPGHDLRWLAADVSIPLQGSGGAARLVLHEARIFGVDRERWVVTSDPPALLAAGLAGTTLDVVTPTLPEVRVLLSDAVAELHEAVNAATAGPLAQIERLLHALGVVADAGGAVPDALDHLLYDPAAAIAGTLGDAARRTELTAALTALLPAEGAAFDLAARAFTVTLSGTPGPTGMLPWSLTARLRAGARPDITLSVGAAGTSPAGGAVLRATTAPNLAVTLDWHPAGAPAPDSVPLWPTPDIAALSRAGATVVVAEIGRIGLGYLRDLDVDARTVIDAVLDAIGLLGPPDTVDGSRRVLSPAGLVRDPVGWFTHPGSFGASGALSPAKVAAFLDALKPILGVPGDPGTWALSSGVTVSAGAASGRLELALVVDTGDLAPIDAAATLDLRVTAALTLAPGAAPRPAVDVSLGPPGGSPGTRAVHVRLDPAGLTVFLRPATGADVPLYPNPAGLGALVTGAIQQALPQILDAIADLSGDPDFRGTAGRLVSAAGELLGVRTGGHFSGPALSAWAADPVAALRAALLAPSPAALTALASALDDVLGAEGSAAVLAGGISVTVHQLTAAWLPNPLVVTIAIDTELPGLSSLGASATLDGSGLRVVDVRVGPAEIPAGGTTLRPYARIRAGSAPTGGRVVELGLQGEGTSAVAARWHLDGAGLQLVSLDGPAGINPIGTVEHVDPEHVAAALIDLLVDLVAGFILGTDAVQAVLAKPVGGTTVRDVLTGPVLVAGGGDPALVPNLFDPAAALGRLLTLAANLAAAGPRVSIDGLLHVELVGAGGHAGIAVTLDGRVKLGGDDVVISLEADPRWVRRPDGAPVPAGMTVFLLDTGGATPVIDPGLEVGGLGIRVSRDSGPLLDLGVTLGSVAVHGYGSIGAAGPGAGVQLQLSDLAVALAGAGGGANPVAEGVLHDAGTGSEKLAPAFSPAVAVQKHGADPVLVSVSAGDGAGPWWLAIQRGFGPVYIEQVGFGVTVQEQQLQRISLLLDGRVSLFGLAAAVDDLQLSYVVPGGGSFVDPQHWSVDLAGFAFSADLAGITLEGGLRRFGEGANVEYVGMLLGRFGVYGLSVFGGYGTGVATDGTRYASFFAFGAVNGPIGGPPAFFLTGIGGGLGINRALRIPTDMSQFGDFVFLRALDPAARPSGDPMQQLESVRNAFPMQHGDIWFAAGISFTSFALVDGIAVISVAIGDGLDIALLGLARMALPRPEIALVSIELGLLARFSTREGVMWIQAQLTDNSWLLNESVRLTGGFAFVTWYKGENAGQFVLTIGGFHPSFHRNGYPEVPRLGFRWEVSGAICIKGEAYFALTSEAVMAGGRLEASAELGPAWAHLVFGADGIVYFDPFRYELDVYASISAGVTIDVWIGEITIKIYTGAELHLEGPNFRGRAKFSVGPVGITVPFGADEQNAKVFLDWDTFIHKYLEAAGPGQARVISAITGKGTLPAGASGTPDGSAALPFVVYPEFEILVKTTMPATALVSGGTERAHTAAVLGIAPMNIADAGTRLEFSLSADLDPAHADVLGLLGVTVTGGAFPLGVWGPPQPDDDRKVPAGDALPAIDGATFTATAREIGTLPTPVNYYQVEIGLAPSRKPLPFLPESSQRASFLTDSAPLREFTDVPAADQLDTARSWLARGANSRIAVAALEHDRSAPPLLGSLGEGFVRHTGDIADKHVVTDQPPEPPDTQVYPPRAVALLTTDLAAPPAAAARTTVSSAPDATRVAAPDLATLRARADLAAPLRLSRQPATALSTDTTVIATSLPLTRAARGAVGSPGGRLAPPDAKDRLAALTAALDRSANGGLADAPPSPLRPGEIAVLQLPNAGFDTGSEAGATRPQLLVSGGPARVIALGHGGIVLADGESNGGSIGVVPRTERLVVLAGDPSGGAQGGLTGWHSGQQLPYLGWGTALAAGATIHAEGGSVRRTRDRYRAGWVPGAELVDAAPLVTTRFTDAVTAVAVLLDDPLGTEAARGLGLALNGASRAVDAAGAEIPPVVVALGNRSAVVYAVVPDSVVDRRGGAVAVGVASQAGWHVAGMVGSPGIVGDLVDRLTRTGIDALIRPLVGPTRNLVSVGWQPVAAPPVNAPQPRRSPALVGLTPLEGRMP